MTNSKQNIAFIMGTSPIPEEYKCKIGVIGGSGLYHLDQLELIADVYPETPWGFPSDKIRICRHDGMQIAFLARHGSGHALNPSELPFQANIAAMKHLGVEILLSFSAVGSLREEIRPLDFVLPNQCIDRTKGIRPSTFFEKGCAGHVEFADPFCQELADIIFEEGHALKADEAQGASTPTMHRDKTLVVMEGPAFSPRAESHLYRSWGCDIINMSTLPEAKLAREAEISYQVICMATDYDCWRENEEHVTVENVLANLRMNSENAGRLLMAVLPRLKNGLRGEGRGAIKKGMNRFAVITAPDRRRPERRFALDYLLPGYF